MTLKFGSATGKYAAVVYDFEGRTVIKATGAVADINQQINDRLNKLLPGVYSIEVTGNSQKSSVVFIKK